VPTDSVQIRDYLRDTRGFFGRQSNGSPVVGCLSTCYIYLTQPKALLFMRNCERAMHVDKVPQSGGLQIIICIISI
jgi:hypothetical protein